MFDENVYASIQNSIRHLRYNAEELENLSKAFHVVGNDTMSEELGRMASSVRHDAGNISDMIGLTLSVNFEDSMRNITKTLDALLKK